MKGFTKGKGKGKKFIPTSKKKGLTKADIRTKKTLPISKKNKYGFVPEHTSSSFQYQSTTARLQGNKQPVGDKLGGANGIRGNDQLHPKGDWKRKKQSLDTPDERFAKSLTKLEKEWEKALKEEYKGNPKLKGQEWDVDITYTGNNGNLEMFEATAQPSSWKKDDKYVKENTWISNDDWMETGDEEENDKLEKLYAKDDQKAEDDYTDWMTDTFEIAEDGLYMSMLDGIEDMLLDMGTRKKGSLPQSNETMRLRDNNNEKMATKGDQNKVGSSNEGRAKQPQTRVEQSTKANDSERVQ